MAKATLDINMDTPDAWFVCQKPMDENSWEIIVRCDNHYYHFSENGRVELVPVDK